MNAFDLDSQQFAVRVQEDLGLVLGKWKKHFGTQLDKAWEDAFPNFERDRLWEMPNSVKDIVDSARDRLNSILPRTGEASVLIRDPREDRLVLTYSTSRNLNEGTADNRQVKDPSRYFDSSLNLYVYPLNDKLASEPERRSEDSQRRRGLTGWVAVSGHYLLVNGEYGERGLEAIGTDRPETVSACNTYGHPVWGRHISEAPSKPEEPKRYIAVPIRSCFNDECTIGVLRYACPRTGPELNKVDLVLLNELAELIGAMLGLETATTTSFRKSLFPDESDNLRRTYEFNRFLRFISIGLRSSIASLYVEIGDLTTGQGSNLRLVDAYGITDVVGRLRDKIADYPEGEEGFTRWLFDDGGSEPIVHRSVHSHAKWQGKNTTLFYGEHFAKFRASTSTGEATKVARKYKIKIVGLPIVFDGKKIGVLKVELPNRFDDSRHYGSSDKEFLKECAAALGPVLVELRTMLKGEFLLNDDVRTMVNVSRMVAQVLRTRLVSPEETPQGWDWLSLFFKDHPDSVSNELRVILGRLPQEDRGIVKDAVSWLRRNSPEIVAQVGTRKAIEAICDVLKEM